MAIQDKHTQSKTASTIPNKNKIPKDAKTINDMAASADREQLSNLDVNSSTPGSQPRWETEPSGATLSTPSAASSGYHGGDKGERHDGRAADFKGWTGENESQRTDRLPNRGDQKVQLNTSGGSGSNSDASLRSKAGNAADEIKDKAGELKNKAGELMSNSNSNSGGMKDKAEDLKHQASSKAEDLKHQASSKAEDLKHRASHVAHDARETASRAGHAVHEQYRTGARKAKQQASQVRSRISETIDQNPLALVAIGVGIGAALGLLLPSTRREDRIMGEQRDRVKEQLMNASAQQVRQARKQLEETH